MYEVMRGPIAYAHRHPKMFQNLNKYVCTGAFSECYKITSEKCSQNIKLMLSENILEPSPEEMLSEHFEIFRIELLKCSENIFEYVLRRTETRRKPDVAPRGPKNRAPSNPLSRG